jgi:hypothetical protein
MRPPAIAVIVTSMPIHQGASMPVHNHQPMTSTINDLPGRATVTLDQENRHMVRRHGSPSSLTDWQAPVKVQLAALGASVMFVYAYVDVLARQRLSGWRGLVVAAMLILAAIEFATADNYLRLAAETVLGSAFSFVVVRLVRRRRASKRRADGAAGRASS